MTAFGIEYTAAGVVRTAEEQQEIDNQEKEEES